MTAPLITAPGIRIDEPREGFYRASLVSGGHPVGIRIVYGQPLDPDTREPLDRSLRWYALANGRDIDIDRVWPGCAGDPISEAEHDYLARVQEWGEENAPDSPQANPFKRVDFLTAPLPF